MNSFLKANDDSIVPFPGGGSYTAVDYSQKEGYFYVYSATYGLAIVSNATTSHPVALMLSGVDTTSAIGATQQCSVLLLAGVVGTYRVKASGTIKRFQRIQLAADGTVVVDAGSGDRIILGVANEDAVTGDLFEASLCTPQLVPAEF